MKILVLLFALTSSQIFASDATLITNANGYTLDNSGKLVRFQSMAFANGKVLGIGDATLVEKFPQAKRIDAQEKVLLPGLIDAHGHLLELGATLLQVDVRDLDSAVSTASKVAAYAQTHEELDWITGRGWNQVLWPDKQFPTAAQLDKLISDRPVYLERIDGHAAWVNSKALELANIDENTPDPDGGKVVRDEQGKATGILIDNAMAYVVSLLPKSSPKTLKNRLQQAGQHLLSVGITSMHDAGISNRVYRFYQSQARLSRLPIRVYAMLSATDKNLAKLLVAGPTYSADDMLTVRSVKAYGDGALGSRGAALLTPYQDAPGNSGLLLTQPDAMSQLFDAVIGAGFQLNYHAIGDRANRLALDQFEKTQQNLGGKQLRNRIEHAQVVQVDDIPRFNTLEIIPSMQPTHATSDMNMAEDRVGKARLAGAYAWQTFLQQGTPLAFGSDFPVELANPFYGLHAAVTRQDRNNQPKQGWIPQQAVTVEQAFRAFTLDAAYAAHQEDKVGRLLPGQWADFILVDQDIFDIEPAQIWKTQVLQTWIAGNKKFSL